MDKLTKKLAGLLALSTAQRVQTLSLIKTSNIKIFTSNIEITIEDIIKTSAPGRQNPKLVIPFFPTKPEICPAKTLLTYIKVTNVYRENPNTQRLFLTTKKPFHNATASTIGRWIRQVLSESGIDTSVFTAHSVRHASTSAADRRGVSIEIIKKTAGWSGDSLIFGKFYNRPVDTNLVNNFAEAVFSQSD